MALVIFILFVIIVMYIALNVLYKRTNHYKNSLLTSPTLTDDVPTDIKLAVFGSTYAQYAFSSMWQMGLNRTHNFALPCESSEADLVKLRYFADYLAPNCVIAITLAPCNTLYHWGQLNEGLKHYGFMPKKEKKDWKLLSYIKYHLPLFPLNIRKAARIIRDSKRVKSIYELVPQRVFSDEQTTKNAQKMAEIWIKLFGLVDLKEKISRPENIHEVETNTAIITQMVDFCHEKGFRPVIVVPPFAAKLNACFSDEYIQSTLGQVYEKARQRKVNIYDYRKDDRFQNNSGLFADGVFLLNQYGSEKFVKCLFDQMQTEGFHLNNETLMS